MAKRKPARRKTTSGGAATSRARKTTRVAGSTGRRANARTTSSSAPRKSGRTAKTSTSSAGRKAVRKSAAPGRRATASAARKTSKRATPPRRTNAPKSAKPARASSKAAPRTKTLPRRESAGRRLQIERDRRLIEETLPTPPSSLDLDRRPSAARSGRAELAEAYGEHNAASPGITAGDVDADWQSAYSIGDEAPGGDMPTPDQDVVEEIGSALGVQYADDEELKGADKIEQRDRHRWELDPASAEDYQDRSRQK